MYSSSAIFALFISSENFCVSLCASVSFVAKYAKIPTAALIPAVIKPVGVVTSCNPFAKSAAAPVAFPIPNFIKSIALVSVPTPVVTVPNTWLKSPAVFIMSPKFFNIGFVTLFDNLVPKLLNIVPTLSILEPKF